MKTEGTVILIVRGDDKNMLILMMAVGWNDWHHMECVDGPETGPGQYQAKELR